MSNDVQQWLSLGVGGLLITLVGFSIWKLIGAWMSLASTEQKSSADSRIRADILQNRLNEEIEKRVALEVEVQFLEKEIKELRRRLADLESRLEE